MKTQRNYIFRGLPLSSDSRTLRYKDLIPNVTFCTWEKKERSNIAGVDALSFPLSKDGRLFFLKYPAYLLYLFLFSLFVIRKTDSCICMDLDTFIPVWLGSFFKKNIIIFDVVDPASQARFKKIPLPKLIDRIEFFFIQKAHRAFFPHDCRISYYSYIYPHTPLRNTFVIENVPNYSTELEPIKKNADPQGIIRIGYFGTLDSTRGLNLIFDFATANPHTVEFIIAGDGPERRLVENKCQELGNIKYLGRFKPEELAKLYAKVNFSWSYYDPLINLHKFAAPNKFYEHLCFDVPIITNKIIPQSSFIKTNHTGIILDEDCKYFTEGMLNSVFLDALRDFRPADIRMHWINSYSNYYEKMKISVKGIIYNSD